VVIRNRFGRHTVHDGVNLAIYEGEILGIVGGSGSGKSVLMNSMLGLHTPTAGTVEIFDSGAAKGSQDSPGIGQKRWGVLFQTGALFSGLTVLENVLTPILEHSRMSKGLAEELACLKLVMVGLSETAFTKYPSELSGGMIKRVALARALAIEPPIVFLDEPTAGLDPISATDFDELILYLREHLNLTVVMISHDLDSLVTICDRFAVIVDKKVIAGSKQEIMRHTHSWIAEYFGGPRGRAVANKA
jgi:phospholipid/cholesterol/gamma-HCH transport system ATP-binding protein